MTEGTEARLSRLEAAEAIRCCIYAYALAGDRGNDSGIVDRIFTDDAIYEAAGMGRFSGRAQIVEGLADIARTVVRWSFHAPGGPLIEVADDCQSARAFWWVWCPVKLQEGNSDPVPHWGAGHYNADLVPDNGAWKFKRVLFETRLRMPYGEPWGDIAGPFEWPNWG